MYIVIQRNLSLQNQNISSIKTIDIYKHMFYTNLHETQEDPSDHTNGVGSTSESDESSHTYIHTQIQCRKAKNLKRRIALAHI